MERRQGATTPAGRMQAVIFHNLLPHAPQAHFLCVVKESGPAEHGGSALRVCSRKQALAGLELRLCASRCLRKTKFLPSFFAPLPPPLAAVARSPMYPSSDARNKSAQKKCQQCSTERCVPINATHFSAHGANSGGQGLAALRDLCRH